MQFKVNSLVIMAFVAGMFVPYQAMADVPSEMKVLERFVGTWKVDQTRKTADGRVVKTTGRATSKIVLGEADE